MLFFIISLILAELHSPILADAILRSMTPVVTMCAKCCLSN